MANPYLQIDRSGAFVDATGKALASGRLVIQPVDGNNNAIPFQVGTDGSSAHQQASRTPVQCTITNGAIDGALQLANPALTSPQGIGYTFTLTDIGTGVVTTYPCVLIADNGSGHWDIRSLATGQYIKAVPVSLILGPQGNPGANGVLDVPTLAAVLQQSAGSVAQQMGNLALGYGSVSADALTVFNFGAAGIVSSDSPCLLQAVNYVANTAGFTPQLVVASVANGQYTVTALYTLPASVAGTNTVVPGAGIPAIMLPAGSLLGLSAPAGAALHFQDGAGDGYSNFVYRGGFVGIGDTGSMSTSGGQIAMRFDVTTLPAAVTTAGVQASISDAVKQAIGTATLQMGAVGLPYNNATQTNYTVVNAGDAGLASTARSLDAVRIDAAGAGAVVSVVFCTRNGNSFTVTKRFDLPALANGLNVFTAGTHYPAVQMPAGTYVGLSGLAASQLRFVGDDPLSIYSGFAYQPAGFAVGTTFTDGAFPRPGQIGVCFDCTALNPVLTAGQVSGIVAASRGVQRTTAPGKNIALFGDSYSAAFAQAWQNVAFPLLGAALKMQDARYGRHLSEMWENYSGTPQGNNLVRAASNTSPASVLIGVATGNTLAQDLAGCDAALIELGQNYPTNPVGTPLDGYGTDSFCGNMRAAINAIHTAAPTIRVFWLTPTQANPSAPAMASVSNWLALTQIIQQVCKVEGAICLDVGGVYGAASATYSTLFRDSVHPTDAGFVRYGTDVARLMAPYL